MGFLTGKRILVTGVISNRSIAYGIARACHREGAEIILTYSGDNHRARVEGLAAEFNCPLCLKFDATCDADYDALLEAVRQQWGTLHGIVHSIAFAPREAIAGNFLDGLSREAFRTAMDISAYSYPALVKALLPILEPNGSVLTLSYLGAVRVVPNYNTMGPCKAALESATRYLAQALGERGIRANAISSGPIRTLAAAGIKDFGKMLGQMEQSAPLRRTVTIDEVGNTAAFLLSDLASGITADVIYVDAGYHAVTGRIE